MKKKILILGSSGNLGCALYKNISSNFKKIHTGLKKRSIDLTNFNELKKKINLTNPDIIINCAAITNVDLCENKKFFTKKINTQLIKNIFRIKKNKKLNFKFIQLSTDQIYNSKNYLPSTEKSKTYCFNEYSRQKLEAEKVCEKKNTIILRCNFFVNSKSNLFNWLIKSKNSKKIVYFFKDIYFNPLNIITLSRIINKIIYKMLYQNFSGIYNLGAQDSISKSEFCLHIIKKLKLKKINYKIVKSDNFLKTRRPKNMVMNIKKFEKDFRIKLPKIKNQINQYIRIYNEI